VSATLVVYESPIRVGACLADMEQAWGDREAFLCREATKIHEEYLRSSLAELRRTLAERGVLKGELVLVVGGKAPPSAATEESLDALYARLVADGKTRREAVKEAARLLGLPAREVYVRVGSIRRPESE
jgi:16S rRNA (cytidine1402-2'-O)-methyltransferase